MRDPMHNFYSKITLNGPQRRKTYLWTWAPSEDSDQHAHSHSLTRTFTVRILAEDAKGPHSDNEDRSDFADTQADLSLRPANMSKGTFSHVELKYIFELLRAVLRRRMFFRHALFIFQRGPILRVSSR